MIQRSILLGVAGACLSACASPQYPVTLPPSGQLALAGPQRDVPAPRPWEAGTGAYGRLGPPPPRTAATRPVERNELPPVAGAVAAPPSADLQPAPPVETAPVETAPMSTESAGPAPLPVVETPQPTFVADPSAPKPQVIVVQRGETMFDLAERHRTPIVSIIEANALEPPYELQPGQKLTIPPPLRYTTATGDTLFGVAQRFSIDPRSLAIMNGTSIAKAVLPGTVLALPPSVKDKGVMAEAKGASPLPPGYRFTPPRAEPEPVQVAALTPPPAPAPVTRPSTPAPAPTYTRPSAPTPTYTRPSAPPPSYNRPAPAPTYARPAPSTPIYSPPARAVVSPPPSTAQVATAAKGRFAWPLKGQIISGFGPKGTGQRNDGINIGTTLGTSVRAAAAGEVVYAGNQVPGFGNLVLLKHPGGWVTAYAHLDKLIVKNRDVVAQGQEVGHAGASGDVGQPQLHFEIRYAPTPNDKARPVDPQPLLQ